MKKYRKWVFFAIMSILFMVLVVLVLRQEIDKFDRAVYRKIKPFINQSVTQIAKGITTTGSGYVILPICIIVGIVSYQKQLPYGKYLITNLVLVVALNQILKVIIERPRPTEYSLITERGFSFPSGHSMVSTAFYGLLVYFIRKQMKNGILKNILTILLSLLILGIGISRIYLGVHFASDVLAGFCFGIAYLIIVIFIIEQTEKRKENR